MLRGASGETVGQLVKEKVGVIAEIVTPNINQYINDFEKLVRLAGYMLGNQETMGFFLEGLPRSVVEAILIPPAPDTYTASKEKAIQIMRSKQILDQIFGPRKFPPQSSQGNFQRTPGFWP